MQQTTLQELRSGLATAKEGLAESHELAAQVAPRLAQAEATFQTADRRHHERLLWASHSRAALPGLAESRKALAEARGELARQREASTLARSVVAEGEWLVVQIERAIDATLDKIERAALSGPGLALPIWD
jgi:hypothetical protein